MVTPPYQIADNLKHKGIIHGFFGSEGGVSSGIFKSLNCGLHKGDEEAKVMQNRDIICKAMGIERMVTLRQVHKNEVLIVNQDTPNGFEKDAMVTASKGLLLAIQTADCAPILLHDPENAVIGAIHAGWRSAVSDIVENTIENMESLGAKRGNIHAAIGPCIQQQNYEVGPEVYEEANDALFFTKAKRPDHYFFNLPGYVHNHLKKSGIHKSLDLSLDTYTLKNQYFSCRRAFHEQNNGFGIQLSVIAIF